MTPVRGWRQAQALPEPRDGRGPLVGAVAGAALGAALSSPHRAAEHAVIGAIFGAALGAAADGAQRYTARAEQRRGDWVPVADPGHANFRRAMAACMQGRGYRVD
jgi:RsiW-degrading membrane proteinase PrsW (M82 family)